MIGTGELLPLLGVREIQDGVVFLENGEVGIGFDLYLPSARLLTGDDYARLAGNLARLFRVVVPIDGRARLYVEAIEGRLNIPSSYLDLLYKATGPIREVNEARLDMIRMRAAEGRVRQWYYTLTISWRPAFPKRPNQSYTPEEYSAVMSEVDQIRASASRILEEVGVQVHPMGDEELREMFFRYFNPTLLEHKPQLREAGEHPLASVILSGVRNDQEEFIRVGKDYLTHVVFHRGPRYTSPGIMDLIRGISGEFLLVLEVRHPDQQTISQKVNLNRVRLEAMIHDMGNRADPEMAAKATMLARGLNRRAQTGEHILEMGLQVILRNRELALMHNQASETYARAQTLPDALVVKSPPNAFEYWLSASPFYPHPLLRRWYFLDLNVAHMAPIRTPWRGSPKAIALYLTKEGSLVAVDPFDERSPAWNGIVVGGTGSGKTFFTQSYLTSFLMNGDFVGIVDKGGGYIPLVQLLDGAIIEFAPGKGVTINPFDLPEGEVVPSHEKKAFLLTLLRQMIPPSKNEAKDMAILTAAIERVYLAHQMREKVDGEYRTVLRTPTLSDFIRVLSTMDDAFGQRLNEEDRQVISAMVQALSLWTRSTPYGQLIDGPTNIRLENRIVYFETTGISTDETLQRVGLLLLIGLLWDRIARTPRERKILVFDEVWALFKNKAARDFIEDLYRRLRRYNASALSISQSLSDFEQVEGVIATTNYLFLLSAPNQRDTLRRIYQLPDDLIEEYERLQPRGEILFLLRIFGRFQGDILVYEPSPYELAAFGTQASEQTERSDLLDQLGSMEKVVAYKHLQGLLEKL